MEMDTPTLIGLIVAGSAAVLAILALLLALFARLGASRALREVEGLRQADTQAESSRWMKDREFEAAWKKQQQLIAIVQRLKEELDRLHYAPAGKLNRDEAIKAISTAGRSVAQAAEEQADQFDKLGQRILRRARKTAVNAACDAEAALKEVDDPAELSARHRATLQAHRIELSELQQMVRNHAVERFLTLRLASQDQ